MQFEFAISSNPPSITMTIYGPTYKGTKDYLRIEQIITDLRKMGVPQHEIREIQSALSALIEV